MNRLSARSLVGKRRSRYPPHCRRMHGVHRNRPAGDLHAGRSSSCLVWNSLAVPAVPITTTATVDRCVNYRSITNHSGAVETEAKRAIESAVSRQPGVAVESGVPHPARIRVAAVSIAAPHAAVPGSIDVFCCLITGGRIVFGPHVAPGEEFILPLGVEFLRFEILAEERFLSLAYIRFAITIRYDGLAFEHCGGGCVACGEPVQAIFLDQRRSSAYQNRHTVIFHYVIGFDHRFTRFQLNLSVGKRWGNHADLRVVAHSKEHAGAQENLRLPNVGRDDIVCIQK